MARFNGKGKQVHVKVPDWIRCEPDEKRKTAMFAYTFMWEVLGFQNEQNRSMKEYFDLGTEDWTDEDTEYIINRFIEKGIVQLRADKN